MHVGDAPFDIAADRPAPHLTFSGGIHRCLGMWLAKAEMEEALRVYRLASPILRSTGHVRSPGNSPGVNVLKAIRTRRSVGRVGGDVADADLRKIVEAGLWAPNHKLSDPLKFVALRGDARKRLGEVWATAEAQRTGTDVETRMAKDGQKPLRAPLILMIAVRTDDDAIRAEEDYATAAAATQNVLLAAHALGYGAIWRSGDMIRSPDVRAFLELDPTDRIVGAVYIGELTEDPPTAPDREVDKHLTILT